MFGVVLLRQFVAHLASTSLGVTAADEHRAETEQRTPHDEQTQDNKAIDHVIADINAFRFDKR